MLFKTGLGIEGTFISDSRRPIRSGRNSNERAVLTVLSVMVVALCGGVGGASQSNGVTSRLLPVDEAPQDPSLVRVRAQLINAADRGDLEAVWRLTDANVQVGWNGPRGLRQLQREWNTSRTPQHFLHELRTVLSLGGKFDDAEHHVFIAPYLWFGFSDSNDMPGHFVAIRPDAPVFSRPEPSSRILTRVSYAVLPGSVAFKNRVAHWINVTLPDGREGFMRDSDARNPGGTRAYFEKKTLGWRMVGFYAGGD